ncbi:hypothetical protein Tco_0519689 [Tanacetum coccineum]
MAVRVLSSYGVALYNNATLQELKAKHPSSLLHHCQIYPYIIITSLHLRLWFWTRLRVFLEARLVGGMGCVPNTLWIDYVEFSPLTPLVKLGGGIRLIVVGTVWRRLVSKASAIMIGHSLDGKALELIMEDGPRCGLHLNVDKTEVLIWPKEDPRSRLEGRVAKTIGLMDVVTKINDPQCELLLLRACTGISKLYFAMRTCPPRVFESAQHSFDVALRFALERIVTASRPGFGDVLNYAFLASRLQFVGLQTKLIRHAGIVASGSTFDDALSVFNTSMEADLLSNPSEIVAPKLMKKMPDLYFTRVTKNAESTFLLSPRQMALWKSQMEDHTSDWLRAVPISGLLKGFFRIFMETMLYRVLVLLILSIVIMLCAIPLSTSVFVRGFQLVRKLISGWMGCDNPLRLVDMLLYSWDGGFDVCMDLTGSSPLTQTRMADFMPGCAVIDAAQRKRVKYMAKRVTIGYGFLPFSFYSFGELEEDTITLLKQIQKFSMIQDIRACDIVHIFNRISFAIAKGPCSTCSKVFAGDIYGDNVVLCANIIGIKHRHNVVCDTLVDICYRSGILAGKKVDIGLDGGCDKPLRPTDMLLYSWDGDFVPVRAVIDDAQRKRAKYMAKCAAIGYGFLPFSFSSLEELEDDAVTLMKRIRKFSMTQKLGHVLLSIYLIGSVSLLLKE